MNQTTKELYQWVKASEKAIPIPEKSRERISIKYKGFADSLIYIDGKWHWNNDKPSEYPVHKDSWSVIEWLEPLPLPTQQTGDAEKGAKEILEVLEYVNNYLKKGGFGRVDCQQKIENLISKYTHDEKK